LPFRVDELDCDAFGSSLHKWLTAPIGTGLLYVRKERIAELWPLMAVDDPKSADIRKFEGIGTHPVALRNAITEAVVFHESIGVERKAARLAYLRRRWQERLAQIPGAKILNGDGYGQACAVGSLTLPNIDSVELMERLMRRYRIHVRPRVVADEFHCIRVSPNVYTTIEEIDRFSAAVERIARA
jgi:selenocysteine lyase/cysteine desulfurase